jgi:acetyl-CoA carboxylase, biotin carboxylase subunit
MGNKSEARKTMMQAGVPVIPGTKGAVYTVEEGLSEAERIGFPVMIKASSGGGGKGMRVSEKKEDFTENFLMAQQESKNSFGDDTMYIERYVRNPRHIEVQILGDKFGNVVQLGERDCSIQRRHQKLIEESPCCAISEKIREKLGETARKAAKAVGYESAGTIEFLLDESGEFFFMEMNTRIQVEHPVTEFVSGVDLIKEQIQIAAGLPHIPDSPEDYKEESPYTIPESCPYLPPILFLFWLSYGNIPRILDIHRMLLLHLLCKSFHRISGISSKAPEAQRERMFFLLSALYRMFF